MDETGTVTVATYNAPLSILGLDGAAMNLAGSIVYSENLGFRDSRSGKGG